MTYNKRMKKFNLQHFAVDNFKPIIWKEKIMRELDNQHMLAKNCTREYEGEIKGKGSQVKIQSILSPEIKDYVPNVTVVEPDVINDESRTLTITESKYFSFKLDKVDEKQSTGGIMEETIRKGVVAMKDTIEQFIASKYVDARTTITVTALTSGNFFSTFMKIKRKLMRVGKVSAGMKICAEVTPEVWEKGVLANILLNQQDNGEMIRKGYYVVSLGMTFYVSNNIPYTETSEDIGESKCCVRTMESIGFAEQIEEIEKYKLEKGFGKGIKALHVYGAKMVKPREAVYAVLTTAAETEI